MRFLREVCLCISWIMPFLSLACGEVPQAFPYLRNYDPLKLPELLLVSSHICCPGSKMSNYLLTQTSVLLHFCFSCPTQTPHSFQEVGSCLEERTFTKQTEIPEWDGVSQDHHKTNKNLVPWEEFIRIINTTCYLRVISDSFISFILLFLSMAKTLLPSDNSVCWLVLVVFSANNMEEIGFDYLWFLFWLPGDEKRELWFKIVICAVQVLGICRTVTCLGIICHCAFVLLRKDICGDSDYSLHTQFRELII